MTSGYWGGCAISLVAHEMGHIVASLALGLPIKRVGVTWRGPYVVRTTGSAVENAITSAAGPLVNIALALLLWRNFPLFALTNLVLGLSNLVPTRKSDGRRILDAMTLIRNGSPVSAALTHAPSLTSFPGISIKF